MRRFARAAIILLALLATCAPLRVAHADGPAAASSSSLSDYEAVRAAHRPMMLEFGATWCGPCKEMKPLLDGLEPQWKNRVAFVRFDVDTKDGEKLSQQKNVTGLPYFIFLDGNGNTVSTASGLLTAQEVVKRLEAISAADPTAQPAVKNEKGCCGSGDDCCKKKANSPTKQAPTH